MALGRGDERSPERHTLFVENSDPLTLQATEIATAVLTLSEATGR